MHHEWYNGEGYPIGKSGDDIPLYARIIKVTDSYDAMISKRPGREQLSPADAIEYMMAMAGADGSWRRAGCSICGMIRKDLALPLEE